MEGGYVYQKAYLRGGGWVGPRQNPVRKSLVNIKKIITECARDKKTMLIARERTLIEKKDKTLCGDSRTQSNED